MSRVLAIKDYFAAFAEHYPEQMNQGGYPVRALRAWAKEPELGDDSHESRFVPLAQRPLTVRQNAWGTSRPGDLRWIGACRTYKGLVNLKSPFDLVLYASLIWELQPATILEFGAMQGGSALWFADQLESLCGAGSVHSFELYDKAIHPRATHSRLTFHHADVRDLSTVSAELLRSLPHPWLIVDDAHTNIDALARHLANEMHAGDYYVWEDMQLNLWSTHAAIGKAIAIAEACKLVVDTKYTDAFGTNVTVSPNGWFKKAA